VRTAAIDAHFNLTARGSASTFRLLPGTDQSRSFNLSRLSWLTWNPAVVRPGSTLFNVRSGDDGRVPVRPGVKHTSVLWVESVSGHGEGAVVRREIPNAEDARPVWLNGTLYAVFIRCARGPGGFVWCFNTQLAGRRSSDASVLPTPSPHTLSPAPHPARRRYRARRYKNVMLARLYSPYREIKLKYAKRTTSEGNWLPFEHEGQLYVSYSLCPHRVLAVDPATGVCTPAFVTRRGGCDPSERGSASGTRYFGDAPVRNNATVLGLDHFKSEGAVYTHFFFVRADSPPFAILRTSVRFRFPTPLEDTIYLPARRRGEWTPFLTDRRTQYSLSLRRPRRQSAADDASLSEAEGGIGTGSGDSDGEDLLVDVGAGDRVSFTMRISRGAFCGFTQWCEGG